MSEPKQPTIPASEIYEAPYAGHEDMWEARAREPGVVPEAERVRQEKADG